MAHCKIMLSETKHLLAKTDVKSLNKVSCSSLHVQFYLKQPENSLTLKSQQSSNQKTDVQGMYQTKVSLVPLYTKLNVVSRGGSVSLRIQSKCGKIRTRNNSVLEHFSRSEVVAAEKCRCFRVKFLNCYSMIITSMT